MITDFADVGALLGFAALPRESPGLNDEYARLVDRYVNDDEFAQAADDVFAGAGLNFVVDRRDGVIAFAHTDSPLRFTTAQITKRITDPQRTVVGAVILAAARTAYPDRAMLDDVDRVAVFTTEGVVESLNRMAQSIADESDEDGDLDDSTLEGWRRWLDLPERRPNAQRASKKDRFGAAARVLNFLAAEGFLTNRGELDGGTWSDRPRFRHAVIALTEDSELYRAVNALHEQEDPL